MNKKQKWKYITSKYDGFLIDMSFDFDKLSKYRLRVDEVTALFEAHQGHIHEQILIYRDVRRPRWIYMPTSREKRSDSIVKQMYNDGILEPMKWDTYTIWRKDNCNENNILNKR